jgi:hypothetical protein
LAIWEPLIELTDRITNLFDSKFERFPLDEKVDFDGWNDTYWRSDKIRKCHLKTIDNRESRKTWLLHINIFPHVDMDTPILGFDVVSGQNKITGSFFDFSPISNHHTYMTKFRNVVSEVDWNKPRELPEWAKEIFSDSMIAAGNVRDSEIEKLCNTTYGLIEYYVNNLENEQRSDKNYVDIHNKYCYNQKLNPHLHNSIISMGISKEDKDRYVNKVLFVEI